MTERTRVSIQGEIDLATHEAFEAQVSERLQEGPVLLDLSGVSFMDSTGIRVLDNLLRNGADLKVARELQPQVQQVLEITGLIDTLPWADD
jgi:anti-anti-sigma factor